MANEGGEWIMRGMSWDDPHRIRTWRELVNWINEVGFLPLFANEVSGFSAEEHVSPSFWWTGDRNVMANEGGEWIMRGMAWDDPHRIRTGSAHGESW